MKFDYDLIVIGGGSAGLTSAKLARGLGKKVAIVEKENLGGECTWNGCVPSKALIKSAYVAHLAKNLSTFGLSTKQSPEIDTSKVLDHVRSVILNVYKTHTPEMLAKQGVEVLFGQSAFIDNHHIGFDNRTISARSSIIATGSVPFVPPVEGIENISYLTNQNIFLLQRLPKSLIILGGGAIGVEMASALNRLGVAVTVIEMQDRILPKEDTECADLLAQRLAAEGVALLTNTRASRVEQRDSAIRLTCVRSDGSEQNVDGEQLLVAVGRRPNLDGLHVERAGVAIDKRGVKVNKYLGTTAPNIYACGDVVGPYLFSHMAFYQATIAARNACIPFFKKKIAYRNIAWVTFTDPELGTAGLTEQQAREVHGDHIKIYRYPYAQLDRAQTECDPFGLGKFICDKRGRLIGAHILGARAGELISEIQVAKTFNRRFADLYHVIHPYPTYSEVIWHAAKKRYIDTVKENIGIQLIQWLRRWRKK